MSSNTHIFTGNQPLVISPTPNADVKLVKAFSMNDMDFFLNPSLSLIIQIGVDGTYTEYKRSFASFIDKSYANTRVVEFEDFFITARHGVKFSVVNFNQNADSFEVGLLYQLVPEKRSSLELHLMGELQPAYIELTSSDPNRGMGVERLYEVTIVDRLTEEEILVAEVSEYPIGAFTIFPRQNFFDERAQRDLHRYMVEQHFS